MMLNRRLFRFGHRVDAIVQTVDQFADDGRLTRGETYIVERALLQLQVEWELFVRNLILDSATGRFSDGSGRVFSTLSIPTPTRERASHVLVSLYPRRRREPDWYVPQEAIHAADLLAVSNFKNITACLGVSPWVITELRYVRNFVAHRSKQSALEMRRRGLVSRSGRISAAVHACAFGALGVKNYVRWSQFMKLLAARLTG